MSRLERSQLRRIGRRRSTTPSVRPLASAVTGTNPLDCADGSNGYSPGPAARATGSAPARRALSRGPHSAHRLWTRWDHLYLGLQGTLRTRTPARLFVIVGTSHHSGHRFTLTRKHFRTPLGVAPTDQTYIDRLVAHYGDGLFDDERAAHCPGTLDRVGSGVFAVPLPRYALPDRAAGGRLVSRLHQPGFVAERMDRHSPNDRGPAGRRARNVGTDLLHY